MTENEAIQVFKGLLDVPCEMLVKYDSVTTEEQKKALVKIRVAEDMAIQALEKQVAMKPSVDEFDYGDGYVCGNCESFLHYVDDDEHIRTNYCCHCGTKIDWQ